MAKLKLAAHNEIRIEKGVPIPDAPKKGSTWPLRAMEVGDSFSLDKDRLTALRSAIAYEKRLDPSKNYTVRTLPTEVRCWRVA